MFKNAMPALEVCKLACLGYILGSALQNCDPECFYILAGLLNVCLRKCYFPDYYKALSVVLVVEKWSETTTLSTLALFLLKSLRSM